MKENKDTTITFRTTALLKSRLETMAAKEPCSLSKKIEQILQKYIDKEKK